VSVLQIRRCFGTWENALLAAGLKPYHASIKASRETIMAAIRECAEALGRAPNNEEFRAMKEIGDYAIQVKFGGWTEALRACGMRPKTGTPIEYEVLLEDWAGVVRKTGRFPNKGEYEGETHHSARPLRQRVGSWTNVPHAFAEYAEKQGFKNDWADVLRLVEQQMVAGSGTGSGAGSATDSGTSSGTGSEPGSGTGTGTGARTGTGTNGRTSTKQKPDEARLYGAALTNLPMIYAPMNEMGVVLLFGAVARKLGFIITWIGTVFPDGEAMREVAPGKYQPVRIEFEYDSRNFMKHMHDSSKCDVIVCWVHNWTECPLEVVELSKAVSF
jgi:hypothetical protein